MSRRAWVLLIALAALWGASYLFIKVALDDLSPVAIVFARTALGALVLAPVAAARGALSPLRGRIGALVVFALMSVAAPFLLITVGEQHIPSAMAGILISTAPIFTVLLAAAYEPSERARGWALVGVLVGLGGVALLFGVDLTGGIEEALGGLAVLLAGVGYAGGGLYLKRRLAGVPPVATAAGTMAVSALVLLPAVPFSLPAHAPALDSVGAIAALGFGATGLGFLVYYTLIADVGPARASIVAYVAPGFSVAYGALLLGEGVGAATVAGLALILAGSYLGVQGRLPVRARVRA